MEREYDYMDVLDYVKRRIIHYQKLLEYTENELEEENKKPSFSKDFLKNRNWSFVSIFEHKIKSYKNIIERLESVLENLRYII